MKYPIGIEWVLPLLKNENTGQDDHHESHENAINQLMQIVTKLFGVSYRREKNDLLIDV
jgi:hypothetical protein